MGVLQRILRLLWRPLLFVYVKLVGQRRYESLVIEAIDDMSLVVLPQVFNPKLLVTGEMFARLIRQVIQPGMRVLDMGTGSGACAIMAARCGAQVVAIDINPEAVRCAQINALLNRVEQALTVYQGDLFTTIPQERFDLVLFNPPFFRGEAHEPLDHAWRSVDTVERFATCLSSHLQANGRALVLLSSDGEEADFLKAFHRNHLQITVYHRDIRWGEIYTVYELRM
ncbi:MAG: hypothetical protein Fur005_33610 [Roseiflexaceae bacterium]